MAFDIGTGTEDFAFAGQNNGPNFANVAEAVKHQLYIEQHLQVMPIYRRVSIRTMVIWSLTASNFTVSRFKSSIFSLFQA